MTKRIDSPDVTPTLGVITLKQGGDGVAYVGLLLKNALADIAGAWPAIIELRSSHGSRIPALEKTRFGWRIAKRQLLRRSSWVVFNHVGIAQAQMLLPRRTRNPYGVILCGIEAWDPSLSNGRKRTLREATVRIAISNHTASRVAATHPDIGPVDACQLGLLPESVVVSSPDRALLGQIHERSALIVGRMSSVERYKGHDELLECWTEVIREIPDAQLVVAGQGDDLTRLRAKAQHLGIAEHVLFLGFVDEATLNELRHRVALFAMPSRGEGFGLVYAEAMRAGLPCIGSTEDAGAEVIADNETGMVVSPTDSRALSGALVALLSSNELRSKFGAAAKRRYDSQFTYDCFLNRLRPIIAGALLS